MTAGEQGVNRGQRAGGLIGHGHGMRETTGAKKAVGKKERNPIEMC